MYQHLPKEKIFSFLQVNNNILIYKKNIILSVPYLLTTLLIPCGLTDIREVINNMISKYVTNSSTNQ